MARFVPYLLCLLLLKYVKGGLQQGSAPVVGLSLRYLSQDDDNQIQIKIDYAYRARRPGVLDPVGSSVGPE